MPVFPLVGKIAISLGDAFLSFSVTHLVSFFCFSNYDVGVIDTPIGARVFVRQTTVCVTKTHLASIKKECFMASTDHSISLVLERA